MRLLITKHARDMMIDRGIDEDLIKRAISRGAVSKQTEGYLASYTYIEVAYKKLSNDIYKIKTVKVIKWKEQNAMNAEEG